MIPVNASGQRLDIYMHPPSNAQWSQFTTRVKARKICNAFHLRGACDNETCMFDHYPIDESTHEVLRYIVKGRPCNKRSACRRLKCEKGHVCQKPGCLIAGEKTKTCLIPQDMHGLSHQIDTWVWPVENQMEVFGTEVNVSADEERDQDALKTAFDEDTPLIDL